MELRELGRTGLRVSPIGLGTTKLGRNQQVKYPSAFELPSDEAVMALLASARKCGINLIDTAPAYGKSEQRLGELLSDKSDWVIATKVGETFEDGKSSFDFSPAAVEKSVERSLARLRIDSLDLVLIHSDGHDEEILSHSGAVEALRALRDAGMIRAFGASTKTVAGGLIATELCDVVMVSYGRGDHSQRPVLEAAARRGVGVLLKKVLSSGHDSDPAAALAEALAAPGVTSAVVGTMDVTHLADNCAAVERTLQPGPD
ncbi:MAG: aldo/keto reductase [Deltaproteobacteria bacterium]|nr:aldo/keto reductase [Deltaproteobacteria bacterium]MBW2697075.1 aldo/keto reductase [Deltaproteobacteria bacterium]